MGKQLSWFSRNAAEHLADPDVLSLDWPAKGVLDIMECALFNITDTPGYFIKRGKALNKDQILKLLRSYQGGGKDADLKGGFKAILEADLLEKDQNGCYFSRRIAEEHEACEKARKGGMASAVKRGVERPVERDGKRVVALQTDRQTDSTRTGERLDELEETYPEETTKIGPSKPKLVR